ncbi:TetR/AcrR family transcriptional regulator [Tenacibaculum sp.]|uniref:TetR/AcrR family transcriptional regulator n=1 Tax=Tenacibaculum sp. TaxID=1906242 RepID=UPI003D0D02F1
MAKSRDNKTEEQILKAAQEIFQSKGMDGARMQEIADKASINKAMLHYYYRSKQLLFEAVFKKAFSLLAPQLNAILNDDSTIEEKIRSFTHNYITFIMKHPYLPNFIIQELNRKSQFIEEIKNNTFFPKLDKFKEQIEKEVKARTIRPISAEQLFINIISLNVFPFVGAPLIKAVANVDNESYKEILEARKKEVSEFIINAIKK